MIDLIYLKGKSVGVFGLGKTGIAVFNACIPYVKNIVCYDDKKESVDNFLQQHSQEYIKRFSQGNCVSSLENEIWNNLDYVIISPGVPKSNKVFKLKTHFLSDIDLLYMHNKEKYYICITGTNGKSTTTALIGHILSTNGVKVSVGGNIGLPVLELSRNSDVFVLELSSFQLDLITELSSQIGIFLNITPDHIDRYGSMDDYVNSKMRLLDISENCIIATDDFYTKKCYETLKKKGKNTTQVSCMNIISDGVSVIEHEVHENMFNKRKFALEHNRALQGMHNKQNIAAAIAACLKFGLRFEDIIKSVESFPGLPHRMEFIDENDGIFFYNDSKATNPEAASKSISILKNIYLLAGGIAKTDDISPILPFISNINSVYLYGIDRDILFNAFKDHVKTFVFDTLEHAMNAAIKNAVHDESNQKNILLAPICASMDQFKNFEERGDVFTKLSKNYVKNL